MNLKKVTIDFANSLNCSDNKDLAFISLVVILIKANDDLKDKIREDLLFAAAAVYVIGQLGLETDTTIEKTAKWCHQKFKIFGIIPYRSVEDYIRVIPECIKQLSV